MSEIPITELALYKMCKEVWLQHQAQHTHKFSDTLNQLHHEVESYLQIEVDEIGDEVLITFVLNRSDLYG